MRKIILMITFCCVGLLFTGCKHDLGDERSDNDTAVAVAPTPDTVAVVETESESNLESDTTAIKADAGALVKAKERETANTTAAAPNETQIHKTKTDSGSNEDVKSFKRLYADLGNLNKITSGTISRVRKAYDNLPAPEKKPEYDNRIKAYEALVNTNSYSGIQKVLQDYPNAFSNKQKAALRKVENELYYQKTIQNKGYIDIEYINDNI